MISDELRRWLHGTAPAVGGRALLALGVWPGELGMARALTGVGTPPVVRWSLGEDALRHGMALSAEEMAAWLPEDLQSVRLAVDTPAPPEGIIRRLLKVDGVASAFVVAERPEGLLRLRPWGWPLRVGLAGFPEGAAETVHAGIEAGINVLPRMVTVRRLEEEAGAVDIAVLRGPLLDAVPHLVRLRSVANMVLVIDEPIESPRVVEAQMATLRAATGAQASALAAPADLSLFLRELTQQLSHAEPLDTAVTIAAGGDVLLLADPAAVAGPPLPNLAREQAATLRRAHFVLPDLDPALEDLATELEVAAGGDFQRERHEARKILDLQDAIEPQLEAHDEPRWCQTIVGEAGDNVLHIGPNEVSFFIGPFAENALAPSSPLPDDLPWKQEGADAFWLTVLFVPTGADAAQRAELKLPRFGASDPVEFSIDVETGKCAAARIVVLFRNRVLQTALLSGRDGQVAQLTDVIALVDTLTDLDARTPFDASIVANCHEDTRTATGLVAGEAYVFQDGGISEITNGLVALLGAAGELEPDDAGLAAEEATKLLVDFALQGRDLYNHLTKEIKLLNGAKRIQIVSLNRAWLLPLEMAYEREAPLPGAEICPNFLAEPVSCTHACAVDPEAFVCPNAFWGLSKTIERHRADPADSSAVVHRLIGLKREAAGKSRSVTHALLGRSIRVSDDEVKDLLSALGTGAGPATSWEAWQQTLKQREIELLVLLPHTDYSTRTLEIESDALARGYLERKYVTGDRDKVAPIVILLGCRTSGTTSDPGGFAARFKELGACAVFHSLADLRTDHAANLALRLTRALMTSDGRTIDALLTDMRRRAVGDGLITALAVAAFGDVDEKV